MALTDILIFALAAPFVMWGLPAQWRSWAIFCGSILGVAWLQYRSVEGGFSAAFEMTALSVLLTVAIWWVIQPVDRSVEHRQEDQQTLFFSALLLLWVWVVVSLEESHFQIMTPVFAFGLAGVGALGAMRLLPPRHVQIEALSRAATLLIVFIVFLLVILKIPSVAEFLGESLNIRTAGAVAPLAWLGISYVAFRLIALLRDFQYGRLPDEGYSLRDVMSYVLFLPAYTAGPIDRAQRFIPEYAASTTLTANALMNGTLRIAIGVFKKFIVADSIAVLAMNPSLIDQTESIVGAWFILYIYAMQIYLDFSGYSDVAIGIGKLYGINLPENFDRPYLAPNIQQFWNRWHITLSLWFRAYYFTPLSRAMIRMKLPRYSDVFLAQLSTMILIGLWHGVSLNFVLWGLWHGVGLFAFKLISDYTRRWHRNFTQKRWRKRLVLVGSVLLTFHFVAIGWVFFALPTVDDSLTMLARLVGA